VERRVTTALSIRGLSLRRGDRTILQNDDLEVGAGEIVALMGASGAGKSTILRAVAALEPFDAGHIRIDDAVTLTAGLVPPQSALRELRARVGMVFQAHALFEHLTVLENVVLAPVRVFGASDADALADATRLLHELGVSHRADALPSQLSGGEAQRVAIARALATGPSILLMDEPTSALDPARRGGLGEILRHLAGQGRAILMATHDADFAASFSHRHVTLEHGVISGTTLASG
jgi:ABC-type polar amino acid transport system ATPase subunit